MHQPDPVPAPAPPDAQPNRTPPPLFRELAGQVLRERRRSAGLRLVDVAVRSGVSAQYISEIERGLKDPSSEILAAVAKTLGMDLDDLLLEAARRRGLHDLPAPRMAEVVMFGPTRHTSALDPICQAA